MWRRAQKVLASNLPQFPKQWGRQGSPVSPDGTFEWLGSVFAVSYCCLVPAARHLTQFSISVLRELLCQKHSQPWSSKAITCLQTLICNNICQGPYLHLSLNPHSPPDFLLVCPNTAQSRNICLSIQWELYSHTQVGTCFHFFRSYVAIVQLLPHFRSRLYIIFWSCCLFAQILEPKPIFFLDGSTARLSHIQGWFLQGIKPGML